MKNILVLVFVSMTLPAFAQGAWNIRYVPISQVKKALIGSEVRIDFKSTVDDHTTDDDHIRQKLLNRDTITLNIAGESRRLIESWKIHVDHGVLAEQTLKDLSDGHWLVR